MELITAKYVLPIEGDEIEDGGVVTELGKILAVGKTADLKGRFKDADISENSDALLMPGLVNAHTHLDVAGAFDVGRQSIATGSPDYIEWLIEVLNHRNKTSVPQVVSGMQTAIRQLISSGTTTVGDMTCFEGAFKILDEMGIRAVVFPSVYAGAGSAAQDRFESALGLLEECPNSDLVSVGLGPFSPYLLSKNLLTIISQHAKSAAVPVQIHAAESFTEMEFFYDSKGSIATTLFPAIGWGDELPPPHHKTPIQYLSEIGFLESSPTIIGGYHLGFRDFTVLARNLSRVVYCPRTNYYLGHGNFPFGKLRENGIPVAFGTDTFISPESFSMWDEIRFVKETAISPLPSTRELLTMATLGGARALNLSGVTGSLAEGKSADYILIDMPECPTPCLIYDAVLKNTKAKNVRKVVVAGEILKTS